MPDSRSCVILEAQISAYQNHGLYREAFLLALCTGGMRIGHALKLTLEEIQECHVRVHRTAWVFDSLCDPTIAEFETLRSRYIDRRGADFWLSEEDTRAFPSRRDQWVTLRTAERWIESAAQRTKLKKWLTLADAKRLGRTATPRRDCESNVLQVGDAGDWLLRTALRSPADFEDAKQELYLRLRRQEVVAHRELSGEGIRKFVVEHARAVKNDLVAPRNLVRVVSIPHYNWVADPTPSQTDCDEEQAETIRWGLNDVHAARFRLLQSRLLDKFTLDEREVVSLLYGIPNGFTLTPWQIALRLEISVTKVFQVEMKASRRAAALWKRSGLILRQTRNAHLRSLAWEMSQLNHRYPRPF